LHCSKMRLFLFSRSLIHHQQLYIFMFRYAYVHNNISNWAMSVVLNPNDELLSTLIPFWVSHIFLILQSRDIMKIVIPWMSIYFWHIQEFFFNLHSHLILIFSYPSQFLYMYICVYICIYICIYSYLINLWLNNIS
jgi:hypothetical protein